MAQSYGVRRLLSGEWGDDVLFVGMAYMIDLLYAWKWRRCLHDLAEIPRWNTEAKPRSFLSWFLEDLVRAHIPPEVRRLLGKVKAKFKKFLPSECWDFHFIPDFKALADELLDGLASPASGDIQADTLYHVFRSPYIVLMMNGTIRSMQIVAWKSLSPLPIASWPLL